MNGIKCTSRYVLYRFPHVSLNWWIIFKLQETPECSYAHVSFCKGFMIAFWMNYSERKADMIVDFLWWVALSLWFKSIFLLYIIYKLKYNILIIIVIGKWSMPSKSIEQTKVISKNFNHNKPIHRKTNIQEWTSNVIVSKRLAAWKKKRMSIKTNLQIFFFNIARNF